MTDLYINGNKIQIRHFDTLPSTNTLLKEECKRGAPNYCTVIADCQSGGRGRLGRTFFSDYGGLYMSFLFRNLDDIDLTRITAVAGISAAEAIEAVYRVKCGIKWVNDLIYNEKKVCGILAEGVISDSGEIEGIVIGIGINIVPPSNGFNNEIKGIAGAVSDHYTPEDRDLLAKEILERFDYNIVSSEVINKYRSLSMVIGKEISVLSQTGTYIAKAVDIDDSFGLTVITDDGKKKTLRSGEVSIRTK